MLKVDKIFVITLDDAYERQKKFHSNIGNLDYEWYIAKKDKESPIRGCFDSHHNVLRIAKERGYKRIYCIRRRC